MTCKDCLYYKTCDSQLRAIYASDRLMRLYCKEYENKSEWVHLPCKVGQKIWFLPIADEPLHHGFIKSFCVDEVGIAFYAIYDDGFTYWHNSYDIGKFVFITKEEAEAELERIKKK